MAWPDMKWSVERVELKITTGAESGEMGSYFTVSAFLSYLPTAD